MIAEDLSHNLSAFLQRWPPLVLSLSKGEAGGANTEQSAARRTSRSVSAP